MKVKDIKNDYVEGVFCIETLDKNNNVIHTYKDKNLIMDKARFNMASLIGGYSAGLPIDKFKLGNKGHNGTDILDYKKVGENDEFVSSRTMMFAEDPAYSDANDVESFVYEVSFDTRSNTETVTDEGAVGKITSSDDTEEEDCTITRIVNDRTVTFIIEIPDVAGNKPGEGEVMPYTEASLWAGDNIFSMKTFPARVKEDTVKLRISWSLLF